MKRNLRIGSDSVVDTMTVAGTLELHLLCSAPLVGHGILHRPVLLLLVGLVAEHVHLSHSIIIQFFV